MPCAYAYTPAAAPAAVPRNFRRVHQGRWRTITLLLVHFYVSSQVLLITTRSCATTLAITMDRGDTRTGRQGVSRENRETRHVIWRNGKCGGLLQNHLLEQHS